MNFDILKAALGDGAMARVGRLAVAGRPAVETPNYFGVTSRGVVPHVTPDNLAKHVQIGGACLALEDFIERPQRKQAATAPILKMPSSRGRSPLHAFTAMPSSVITVMSARRHPAVAVAAPTGNTHDSVSIYTSTGFAVLKVEDYHAATRTLKPDIGIPLVDLSHKTVNQNSKRAMRMAERTEDWARRWFDDLDPETASGTGTCTFVPILPVSYPMQWEYLKRLEDDYLPRISGLALHDVDILPDLAGSHPALLPLPRLSLDAPTTPHHILRQIALGVDIFVLPFINSVSDSGVALTFTFPAPPDSAQDAETATVMTASPQTPLPLGIDILPSPSSHQTSLTSQNATNTSPLQPECDCYTCTRHHQAYVAHLLAAREMLGWTLLQIHNHHVLTRFFAGVRAVLAQDSSADAFEVECRGFAAAYESELPPGAGPRPRARGYHFKSDGGEERLNKPAWGKFGGEEGGGVDDGVGGESLDGVGTGVVVAEDGGDVVETPVVPDEDARELYQKGFAEIHRQES